MIRSVFALAAALALGMSAQTEATQIQWRHITGLSGPGHAGMQIGDFDGDGRTEWAVTAWDEESFGMNGDQSLVVLQTGSGPGSPLQRKHISTFQQGFGGRIVLLSRPGLGDGLLASVQPTADGPATLMFLSGLPLRVERKFEAPARFVPSFVADVDGNGRREIVGLLRSPTGPFPLAALDFDTGALAWSSALTAQAIVALQLDADPALEIVLAGTPGRIIDGATRQIETAYPAGFGATLATGNFDANPQTTEFAATDGWSNLVLFRGSPFSPIGDLPTGPGGSLLARDLDQDGIDELISAHFQSPAIRAFDPITGQVEFNVSGPSSDGISSIAIGDVDGLPGLEIASSAGLGSTGEDSVTVKRFDNSLVYYNADQHAPHSPTLLADVDADGSEEAIFVSMSETLSATGPSVVVLSAHDGTLEREGALRRGLFPWGEALGGLFVGQLDEDPALEIGLGIRNSGLHPALALVDGGSLQSQWGEAAYQQGSVDAVLAEPAGDGVRRIALATSDNHLVLLDPATGSSLWSSVQLGPGTSTALAAANIDADQAQELLIATFDGIYAFDGATRLLEWSIGTEASTQGMQVWGGGAECRIAAAQGIGLWSSGTLKLYRCSDRSIVDSIPLPANTEFVRVVETSPLRIIAAAEGRLHTLETQRGVLHRSDYLGSGLGRGNRGTVRVVEPGRRYEGLFGTNTQVIRFTLDADEMLRDGFE